jgi:hypothetical protein
MRDSQRMLIAPMRGCEKATPPLPEKSEERFLSVAVLAAAIAREQQVQST